MLNVITNKPEGRYIELISKDISIKKCKDNNHTIELKAISGITDKTITAEDLRKVYKFLIKNNELLYIDSSIIFENKAINGFIKALIEREEQYTIYTGNISLLNIINKETSKKIDISNGNGKVLVIDTHNFYHRVYHSVPKMYDKNKNPISLLKSLSYLIKWVNNSKYNYIVFASESKNGFFRRELTKKLYGEEKSYKANRKEKDRELLEQIDMCNDFLESLGYIVLRKDKYEADDIIASITDKFSKEDNISEIHALTTDKDMTQLYVYQKFYMIDPKTKNIENKDIILKKLKADIKPEQVCDFQAIVGDTSDNVIGIKGIGSNGAEALLKQFGTLENIINNFNDIEKVGIRKKVEENIESAIISKDLVFMRRHLLEDLDIYDFSKKLYDINYITSLKFKNYDIVY